MNEKISRDCAKELKHLVSLLQKKEINEAQKVYELIINHYPPIMEGIISSDIVLFMWDINEYLSGYPSVTFQEIMHDFALLERKWFS